MGIFRTPKYQKSEAEIKMEEERLRQIEEAEEEKKAMEEAEKKRAKRFASGKLGPRSLFARAGGRGFYTEGEET